jgi:rubrerythrin/DNA-directed RNA polymerase subunit RPC12/RpoP
MEGGGKDIYFCGNCGAEANLVLEGLESVEDVIKRERKVICETCGKEIEMGMGARETYACQHCGAEADMTLEGFERVEDVIKREKKLTCKSCGKAVSWTGKEDLKAVKVAMEAEKEAFQLYSKAAKLTRDPRGKEMFQQLSEFEMNHYKKLQELSKSLADKGDWILYSGTSFKKKSISQKAEKPKGQQQMTDMDALRMAIKEEKKAQAYYQSMAELTRDPRGKDMYKRLAGEEALHEKILNDEYYSLHNTGVWSWGD